MSQLNPPRRRPLRLLLLGLALVQVAVGAACIDGEVLPADTDPAARMARVDDRTMQAPPRTGFEPVANALVASCGTLDCHGQMGRNLRLFGGHGLRLASSDDPGGKPTTAAEYQASYWSTVGLEPEILDQVVREDGAQPERLMLVRKARGLVKHKGGTLMQTGDALDRCLLLWLGGHPDLTLCQEAQPQRPGGPG